LYSDRIISFREETEEAIAQKFSGLRTEKEILSSQVEVSA